VPIHSDPPFFPSLLAFIHSSVVAAVLEYRKEEKDLVSTKLQSLHTNVLKVRPI